jgi:hypothetical protein
VSSRRLEPHETQSLLAAARSWAVQRDRVLELVDRLIEQGVSREQVILVLGFDPERPPPIRRRANPLHKLPFIEPTNHSDFVMGPTPADRHDAELLWLEPHIRSTDFVAIEPELTDRRIALPSVLAVSGPSTLDRWSLEVSRIRDALTDVAVTDQLSWASPHDLAAAYRRLQPVVVHLAGHNEYGGIRMKCDPDGVIVSFEDIADLLDDSYSPSLIVLSACESQVHARHFASRFASVLSWRDKFDDDYAASFSHTFYGALAQGNPVGHALETAHDHTRWKWPQARKPHLLGQGATVFPRFGQ